MKTKKSKKTSSSSSKVDAQDWLYEDPESLRKAEQKQERQAKLNRRAPELYIKDGESVKVRFMRSNPAGMYRYTIKMGKRFHTVTQPGPKKFDLMARNGLHPSFKYVYEVINRTGYTDKQGKKIRNQRRFFWVTAKLHKAIQAIKSKRGDLANYDIEITRSGKTTDTTYIAIPEEPKPLPPEIKSKEKPLWPTLAEWYAPPSKLEQKTLMKGYTPSDD